MLISVPRISLEFSRRINIVVIVSTQYFKVIIRQIVPREKYSNSPRPELLKKKGKKKGKKNRSNERHPEELLERTFLYLVKKIIEIFISYSCDRGTL